MNKKEIQEKLGKIQESPELLTLSNHTALYDYVIVVPALIQEPGVTKQSHQFEDRPDAGLVVSVGSNVETLEVGDVVFFGPYSHFQITHDDLTYLVLRAEDIVCKTNSNE